MLSPELGARRRPILDFEILDDYVCRNGKRYEINGMADEVSLFLQKPRGPVLLVSGELHPGAYNKSKVPQALRRFLARGDYPATLCWGPNSYTEGGINQLHNAVLELIGHERLTVLASQTRQYVHFWLLGNKLVYQGPHRAGASRSEKTTFMAEGRSIADFVIRCVQEQEGEGYIVRISQTPDALRESQRTIDVELGADGGIVRYLAPASVQEAWRYFLMKPDAASSVEQMGISVWNQHLTLNVVTYQPCADAAKLLANWERHLYDRYPELSLCVDFTEGTANGAIVYRQGRFLPDAENQVLREYAELSSRIIDLDLPKYSPSENREWWNQEGRFSNQDKVEKWVALQNRRVVASADTQEDLLCKIGFVGCPDSTRRQHLGVYVVPPKSIEEMICV